METERSLTRLQQPVAYPRAHPDESSQRKCTSNPTVAALHHQTLMDIAKHLTDDVYAPLKRTQQQLHLLQVQGYSTFLYIRPKHDSTKMSNLRINKRVK